jgi:hypothetical protein
LAQAFAAGEEIHMKPQEAVRRQPDPPAHSPIPNSDLVAQGPSGQLSEEQAKVLGCLRAAGSGLTVRQLEARTACAAAELEEALGGLIRQDLVSRLNTVIPSFACRSPDIRVYAE